MDSCQATILIYLISIPPPFSRGETEASNEFPLANGHSCMCSCIAKDWMNPILKCSHPASLFSALRSTSASACLSSRFPQTRFHCLFFSTQAALKQLPKNKVPSMAVIIKSLMRTNVDAGAVFKDPTGKSEKKIWPSGWRGWILYFLEVCGYNSLPSPHF